MTQWKTPYRFGIPCIKLLLLCYILFAVFFYAASQQSNQKRIDSLKKVIQNPSTPNDTNKVSALCEIGYFVNEVNHNDGFNYVTQALQLAKKLAWKKGIGMASGIMGKCYWAKSDYVSSLTYYQNELEIFIQMGDEYSIIHSLESIGTANFASGNYDNAIEYYNKAVKRGANSNSKPIRNLIYGDAGALNFISMAYQSENKLAKAAEYCELAVKGSEKDGNEQDAARILSHLANINTAQKNYAEAEKNINRSLTISKKNNDLLGQARCYEVLAYIQESQLNYLAALSSYKEALKINTLINDKGHVATNYAYIGYTYMQIDDSYHKEYEKTGYTGVAQKRSDSLVANAAASLEKAIEIALPLSSLNALQEYEFRLSLIYERQGNYGKAVKVFKTYLSFKDSISNSDIQKKFTEQMLKYEYGKEKDSINYINKLQQKKVQALKKGHQLTLLKQRQLILYGIAGVMLTGFITSFFVYRNRLQRINLKNELAEERSARLIKEAELNSRMTDVTFSALRSQMNPHFIFNCLNSIKLYTEQNNSEAASEYLTKFSKLIRRMLDSARSNSVTLASEIAFLQLYLEMEAMRFKEKLQFDIKVDDNVNAEFIDIPPLLIQPYVENAIWHGLMQKQEGGRVTVHISLQNDELLVITVEDNGIGREKAAELKSKTAMQQKSFGTRLTAERIALINEKYKTGAHVIIEDLHDDIHNACGTRATIKLPVK